MKRRKGNAYHRFSDEEKRFIRKWYPRTMTMCVAHILGLSVLQVENYVLRNAGEPWTKKKDCHKVRSVLGRQGAKKRWRAEKKHG